MKKSICLILSILLLLSFAGCGDETVSSKTPLPGGAGNYQVGDFKYQVQEDGTAFVKYVGEDSNVVFPEEISGYKVTGIQARSCRGNKTLRKVTIPSSVKTIEPEVFQSCTFLHTVVLNNGLVSIGRGAFMDCTALENITLPESLETIGIDAFSSCSSLKSIHIPKNVKNIERYCFFRAGLESVTFDEGVEKIGDNAFAATKTSEITFPKTLKILGHQALANNENLVKVSLNEGLETMDSQIFTECNKLIEITIPSTVKNMTEFVFHNNTSIKIVKFNGDAPEKYVDPDTKIRIYSSNYTVYYHKGAKGFTSPTWNGYKTEIW